MADRAWPRAALGRADLLRIRAALGDEALAAAARACGYEDTRRQQHAAVAAGEALVHLGEALAGSGLPPLPERPGELPLARFFRLVEHQQLAPDPARVSAGPAPPPWLARAEVLHDDERPPPAALHLPRRQPLTRWSRLWPFLRRALGRTTPAREPDWRRLLERLTRGEALRRLPLLSRHGWSPRISLLIDYSRATQVLHEDFNALQRALAKRHGRLGLERWIVAGDPGRELRVRRPGASASERWPLPAAETPLLIVGDCGLLDRDPAAQRGWIDFSRRLNAAGCRPLILCPAPASRHPASVRAHATLVEWDRHSRLRPATAAPGDDARREQRRQHAVDTLLALLAPAVVIDPDLLRALRFLLPAGDADVLAEIQLWQHPDFSGSALAGQFAGPAAIADTQQKFAALAEPLRNAAVKCLLAQHAALPASVRYAEVLTCLRLAPPAVPAPLAAEARRWQEAIARTASEQRQHAALHAWLERHAARQSDAALAANPVLAAHWALAQRARLAADGALELPAGVRSEDVAYFLHLAPAAPSTRRAALRQRGDELWLEAAADDSPPPGGSPCGEVTLLDSAIWVEVTCRAGAASAASVDSEMSRTYLATRTLPQRLARLTHEVETIGVHGESFALTFAALTRPAWAKAIGRDAHGLYAEIAVGAVRQRFRWIAPGTFRMGSPADEPERRDNEEQHEVTLTCGYWLADTACTQALWKEVMGDNPSRIADDARRPVETVSWNDVQRFLVALNQRVEGLSARLPSEAEWEYACRAGTTTPFSFGAHITPEQVNYNGNYPYAGGRKGLNRETTVAVASLPANAWGLYEMHGNVWEWCADRYGVYPTTPQRDPPGAASGAARVLRGGSWLNVGRRVRSARRDHIEPGLRYDDVGFRLALGPWGPVEPA